MKIAVRSLFRSPGFAVAGILTLAIAVGMATSVFGVVNAMLLRPLPYKDSGRLAMIWSISKTGGRGPVSFEDFEDWRRNSKTIESGGLFSAYYKPTLTGIGGVERLAGLLVSHQYFTVMGARPLYGRFFTPEEDRDGPDNVVVLAYDLWRTKFSSDPAVVGRSILLNARPHTIVGVAAAHLLPLPPSLDANPPQIYRPVGEPFDSGARDGRHLEAIVRLRPGASIEQAQAELDVRCRQMERAHPDADAHLAARIVNLKDDMTRNVRSALLALQGAVLALLLIACANVANLFLAKSTARRREMAIRAALGAEKPRLARLLLMESLVLGVAGGLCGILLAFWASAGLSAFAARVLPDAGAISIDLRVLAFSFMLSIAASLLFGIAPVLQLDTHNLETSLKSGGRVAGDRRNRLRQFLAAGQIALAMVLLAVTGLVGKSFLRLQNIDPGFNPRNVLAASVSLPGARYANSTAVVRFFDRALTDLAAIPGVRQAAIVSVVPMSGNFDRTGFEIAGRHFAAGETRNPDRYPDRYIVSPSYFQTVRIPLRQGRLLDVRDGPDGPPVCVISEAAARLWFAGESPLGRKVRAGSAGGGFTNSPFREVVGVVGDVAQYGLGLPATPQIYMPYAQYPTRFFTFMVQTTGDPMAMAQALRRTVFAIDAEQPVYDVVPLEEIVSNTMAARRMGLWMLLVFAITALLLAALGVYAVVSYSVTQRTPEFGVRMVLGAEPASILGTALRDSMLMIAAGLAAGLAGSFAASRMIRGFLYGASTADFPTLIALAGFLFVVALVACYLPARRAAGVDPIAAIRYE